MFQSAGIKTRNHSETKQFALNAGFLPASLPHNMLFRNKSMVHCTPGVINRGPDADQAKNFSSLNETLEKQYNHASF